MKLCRLSLTALALVPLVGIAGCSTDLAEIDDYHRPAMHYERYPIEVAKGAVRLDVSTKRSRLTLRQEDSVTRFGQQAVASGAGRIEVKRPSGAAAGSVAERVNELLIETGIPRDAIVHSDYFGCATQHNIAAVVANPEDFETPRTATPSDPMRRYQVFIDYRKPKNTATSISSSETQTVSDVAQQ